MSMLSGWRKRKNETTMKQPMFHQKESRGPCCVIHMLSLPDESLQELFKSMGLDESHLFAGMDQ
jgi:hypothetical protein